VGEEMELVFLFQLYILKINISSNNKFAESGLVPLSVLRKIEEKYENDLVQLQTAFNDVDQCSSIGK